VDEFDLDVEQEQEQEQAAPEPAKSTVNWEKEAREARKENQKLRSRMNEVMAERFGSEVLELVPEEVASWEKRWELAEKIQAKFRTSGPSASEDTAEGSQEGPTPQEQRLAAAATGPGPGTSSVADKSAKELFEQYRTDPTGAIREAIAKYRAELS
jgi:hypothetical protein